jgi:TPR repeat protein
LGRHSTSNGTEVMKGSRLYSSALREMHRRRPDTGKAYELLSRACKMGHGDAMYALGTWHLHGRHVKKDRKKAVEFFEEAAKKHVPAAMCELAIFYEKGEVLQANKRRAFELYLTAAAWGHEDAFHEVGRCLYYGIGTTKQRRLADIWLQRAEAVPGSR